LGALLCTPLILSLFAKVRIIGDHTLELTNLLFKTCVGEHHPREGESKRLDNLWLRAIDRV